MESSWATVPVAARLGASRSCSRRGRVLRGRGLGTTARSSSNNECVCRSGPCPAVLVVGTDPGETQLTADAVSRALGIRVVSILHDDDETTGGGGRCRDGARLFLDPGPFPECWHLKGASAEDAALCGADPTAGLVVSLGFQCVMCVVGIAREPCLGEDFVGASCTNAGRRTAVSSGTPTIVVAVPTTSKNAPVAGARSALEIVLLHIKKSRVIDLESPRNSPRSHFPFPTKARWAGLGSDAFPLPDDDMASALFGAGTNSYAEFASKDCWSLGGLGGVSPVVRGGGDAGYKGADSGYSGTRFNPGEEQKEDEKETRLTAQSLRASLRDAFRDGDLLLTLNVPPLWSPARDEFATCRPGVLWRQERVTAFFAKSSDAPMETSTKNDTWGRTLPVASIGSSASDARFVRQLATERLVEQREFGLGNQARQATSAPPGEAPVCFVVNGGVVVADDCVAGDVDAVFGVGVGKAAVTAHVVWPIGHPFALREDATVEALRPCPETGLPLWLVEDLEGNIGSGGGGSS